MLFSSTYICDKAVVCNIHKLWLALHV